MALFHIIELEDEVVNLTLEKMCVARSSSLLILLVTDIIAETKQGAGEGHGKETDAARREKSDVFEGEFAFFPDD